MARKSLKSGTLTAPLPPVMVTVGTGELANIITIAWTGILSTHPARTYISVRPERHSYKLLRELSEFVINLPTADMARTVDYVGIYTGAKVNKFEKTGLTAVPSENVAPPTIAECPVALECRVVEVIPMGTHDVFIADILSVSADEKIFSPEGKLCFDKANLLAYAHGEYYALGEKLGSFGFSAKKGDGKAQKKPRGGAIAEGRVAKKEIDRAGGKAHGTSVGRAAKSGKIVGNGEPLGKTGASDAVKEDEVTQTEKRPFYADIAGKRRRGGGKRK